MSIAVMQGAVGSCGERATPLRWPVAFGGCFGWFHAPGDQAMRRVGVVLCAGLKQDAMTGHRPFRLLADALAAAGYPTLRFDYPGVGDSCDPAEDTASPGTALPHIAPAEYWGAWQRSVHAAVDWLHSQAGTDRVVLCGLRLGATLAATVAAERADVAGLMLLAPVLRGRSYMRQLSVEATMHDPAASAADGIVLHELRLSRETVERVNKIDLRAVVPAAEAQILVHATAGSPVLAACADAWRRNGAVVACEDFAGLEPFQRPAFMNHEAPPDVGRLVRWLADAVPAGPASTRAIHAPGRAVLHPAGCLETPLGFGPGDRLFGVLCEPDAGPARAGGGATDRLAVVIGNSGGEPHTGFARVSVNLARHLAARGFASLRMDFGGLGDSMAEGDAATHVFETDRQADFAAAIDALQARGFRRFAIHGLCSGAYHALHAALADPRVSRLILINLPFFQWQTGTPIEALTHVSHVVVSPGHLLRRLGGLDFWRQALRGRRDIRLRIVAQSRWFAGRAAAMAWRAAGLLGIAAPANFARDSMAALSTRTRTLLLFSEWDAGRARLAQVFGPTTAPPGATVRVLRGLDHALTGAAMQHIAADEIVGFLEREESEAA